MLANTQSIRCALFNLPKPAGAIRRLELYGIALKQKKGGRHADECSVRPWAVRSAGAKSRVCCAWPGKPKPKRGLARYNLKMDQSRGVRFRVSGAGLQRAVLAGAVHRAFGPDPHAGGHPGRPSERIYIPVNEMEMKTNLSAVQEYATNTLKMVKIWDRSQVTYVTTGQENKGGALGHRAGPPGGRDIADGGQLYGIPRPESIEVLSPPFFLCRAVRCGKSR